MLIITVEAEEVFEKLAARPSALLFVTVIVLFVESLFTKVAALPVEVLLTASAADDVALVTVVTPVRLMVPAL